MQVCRSRIGVVDDDDAVRESLRFLLETAGYCVITYDSASDFLRDATPRRLSCLLVDQHMPDVTGLQLVGRLREEGTSLPIALITGSPTPDLLRRAEELGVATVLEKPLMEDVLLDFVEHSAV